MTTDERIAALEMRIKTLEGDRCGCGWCLEARGRAATLADGREIAQRRAEQAARYEAIIEERAKRVGPQVAITMLVEPANTGGLWGGRARIFGDLRPGHGVTLPTRDWENKLRRDATLRNALVAGQITVREVTFAEQLKVERERATLEPNLGWEQPGTAA
jgi:hypothetical protein